MNDKNRKYLWRLIQLTGDYLVGKLPNHTNHPKGRNPYAHIALKIKNKFNFCKKIYLNEKLDEVKGF